MSTKPAQPKRVTGFLSDDGEFFTERTACELHNAQRALESAILAAKFDPAAIIPLVLSARHAFERFCAALSAVEVSDARETSDAHSELKE